jgi:hypothetical protein
METHAQTATRQIHEFYIAQINHLIANDRESLIDSLVEDFDRSSRHGSGAGDTDT